MDLDGALFEHGLGEPRRRVAAGAPGGAGGHGALVAADRPDLAAGMLDLQARVIEHFPQELPDIRGVDPGRAEPRVDLPGRQVGRDHPAQCGDVDGERGVIGGGALGVLQLVPHLPRQVLRGGHQPPGPRLGEHQGAELLAGVVVGGAEQPGDLAQPHLTAGIQADGQRVGRGVGAQPRQAGGDDPFPEDGRLGGALPGRVEFLQGEHQRGERVGGEPALPRPDPRHHGLAGGRVDPAGAPQREPVQRPVGGEVAVVAAAQLGPQPAELGTVVGGGGLGREQRPRAVAQRKQLPQLGRLAARHRMRLLGAEDGLGERAVRPGAQVPVGLRLPAGCRDCRRGDLRDVICRCVGQASSPGTIGQRHERGGQSGDRVARCADHQVIGPVGAVHGSHPAEDHLRVVQEVLVDRHLGAVQLGVPRLLPRRRVGLAAWFAAAQHEQVGHHGGAGGPLVGAAGQPDRADQVGQRRDFPARRGVAGIHRVPGRENSGQAAGADQAQRLDDEVVVDGVPGLVVAAVVQHHVPERHVPDRQVIAAVAVAAAGERLGADLRIRVQQGRDAGRHRVQLDPGQPGSGGGERDEVPAAAARLQHPAAVKAERLHRLPHRFHERGVGVMGVQRVPPGRRQLRRRQQHGQLLPRPGVLGAAVIEYLRHRAPPRPPAQHFLLGGGGGTALLLNGAQHRQRGEVRAHPAHRPRRGQVVLAAGPEPRYCGGGT